MSADSPLTDTRDMYSVHEAFRRGLADARSQLASANDGNTERTTQLADYFDELLWLLHAHHAGEDELLYPLLLERVPEQQDLFLRMDAQHLDVTSRLEAAQHGVKRFRASGSNADGTALADSCEALLHTLADHLSEEEVEVLPFVGQVITPEEWGALPEHAFSHYTGTRMWLPFGLAIEAMPDDMLQGMFANPSPIAEMWLGGGSDAFTAEMMIVRV